MARNHGASPAYKAGEVPIGRSASCDGVDVQILAGLCYACFGAVATSWLIDAGQLLRGDDSDEVLSRLAEADAAAGGGMQVEKVFLSTVDFVPDQAEAWQRA